MKLHKTIRGILATSFPVLLTALATTHEAGAFTTTWHYQIIEDALAGQGFDPGALSDVANADVITDTDYAGDSDFHYDNCNWSGAQERLEQLSDDLVTALKKKDDDLARNDLGLILHQVQDFYARSNWVETYMGLAPSHVPVADLLATAPADWFSGVNNDQSTLEPFAVGCPDGTPSRADFNKDQPMSLEGARSCGYTDPSTGAQQSCFDAAYAMGVKSTVQQWGLIEAQIQAAYCGRKESCAAGDKAIQRLLSDGHKS